MVTVSITQSFLESGNLQQVGQYLSGLIFETIPKSFDVWKFLPENVLNIQNQIHRNVFMVYLRMSTHKESKKDFFTPSTFGEILYENFLFDIPKMMDLCALYGGEESGNKDLLRKMLENVFNKQPKYVDDLYAMIPSILQTFETIEQEFGETDDGIATEKVTAEQHSGLKRKSVNDIVFYLFDTCQTLLSFMHNLPTLCKHFFRAGFVQRVAGLYEEIMPHFDKKYRGTAFKTARSYLKRCKIGLIKMCHFIIVYCVDPSIDSDNEVSKETKENCLEDFLSVVTEILSYKEFLRVYHSYYGILVDTDIIRSSGLPVDETRLQYIISAAGVLVDNACEKSCLKSKKTEVPTAYNKDEAILETLSSDQRLEATATKVGDAELSSMVSHVKELLPDCGEELIIMCLREADYDIEKTVNSILENRFPPALQDLDRSHRKTDVVEPLGALSTRHSVYDHDQFDVFSKTEVDFSRVHKGKSRFSHNVRSVMDDKKDIQSVKDVVLNYDESFDDYEDEYDDTYDTQDIGAQDIDSADELRELTSRRAFTTPLVLRNVNYSSDDEEENSDSKDNSSVDTSREATDPRQSNERENPTNRQGNRERGKRNYRGGKDKERDHAYKDKHKAKIANHNRKAAAAKKQSRGMAS